MRQNDSTNKTFKTVQCKIVDVADTLLFIQAKVKQDGPAS